MSFDFTVPGLFVPVRQSSSMACWAAMFTMMYSWKNKLSISITDAVKTLGEPYTTAYKSNSGLPIEANRRLSTWAGMTAEPLYNPSITGWLQLLRRHGLLWTSFGWQVFAPDGITENRAGRHHAMSAARMITQHETGFAMRPLSDEQLGQFSQIMHY